MMTGLPLPFVRVTRTHVQGPSPLRPLLPVWMHHDAPRHRCTQSGIFVLELMVLVLQVGGTHVAGATCMSAQTQRGLVLRHSWLLELVLLPGPLWARAYRLGTRLRLPVLQRSRT